MLEINKIHQGDCLEVMKQIDDKSVDMILCDLPYGTTACSWDLVISLEDLWKQYERIIKDRGAIVLTASQPFTSVLIMSNIKLFRYTWVLIKSGRGGVYANKMPIKNTEDIIVFYKRLPTYNPQLRKGRPYKKKIVIKSQFKESSVYNNVNIKDKIIINKGTRQPLNNIQFKFNNYKSLHPTQKPVELFKYLIKTYSNEKDMILDNCIGSGTTAVACKQTNRKFIGIELEEKYVKIANERLQQESLPKSDEVKNG